MTTYSRSVTPDSFMTSETTRQFAVRLPVSLIRKLDAYTERRKKETGISSLKRADVVRALLENGMQGRKK